MNKKTIIAGLTFMSAMGAYAMTQEADACGLGITKFDVTADVLNVRPEPNTSKNAIGKLRKGQKVVPFELSNGWGKIKLSNGLEGWVCMTYLSEVKDYCNTPEDTLVVKKEVFVDTNNLNLRERPTTQSYSKMKLSKGTKLSVHNESGNWLYVSYGNEYGWVSASYVTEESPITPETPYEYIIKGEVYDETGELRWFERTVYVPVNSSLNIRQLPTTDSKVVAKVVRYDKIFVSGISNGFYRVRGIDKNGNSYDGFAHSKYIF